MRQFYFFVFGLMLICGSIGGCGSSTATTDLGAIDPNEEMGMEEEAIEPVNVPASEV